ncbi:MAG TPA: DUF4149 domain-containing protein [Phycisphaerae bacterium]|nr:DUF4149 domain-containing protein [Phycisphaerae bacterium]HRW55933.1 DUF4149 domain-containing protein [Phycisphaerae bacterium]
MLATLAAGVWLGGLAVLGVIVAKNTFSLMPQIVSDHPSAAAGIIMAQNFGEFNGVQLFCAAILVVTTGICAVLARRKFGPIVRLLLSIAAAGLLVYSVQFVTPMLTSMQADVAQAEEGSTVQNKFDDFHRTSVRIAGTTMCLLAMLTLSLGWAGPPKPFVPDEEVVMPATPASMP